MTVRPNRRTRLARRLGWDGNPLRRRTDFIDAWLLPLAIAAFLALCPFTVLATVKATRAANAATERAESSWYPVRAVLLRSVPRPAQGYYGGTLWLTQTPARWTAGGREQTGDVPVARGSEAGSSVTVWVDRAGQLRPEPMTRSQAAADVVETALAASVGLAAVLGAVLLLARWLLYWRRIARWESGWLSVGPTWTRQH